mgnify:CR=1 FL=1
MRYADALLDHFYNPRNAFRMQDPTLVGAAGTPGRGPFLVLYLRVEGERISAASFQTYGCAPAIASGSLLADRLPGSTRAEAASWTAEAIAAALGGVPEVKRHCPALAAEALRKALTGWPPSVSGCPTTVP